MTTKLQTVKDCINKEDYINAIKIVSKFFKLDKSLSIVKSTHEAINNPRWETILLKELTIKDAINLSIIRIKEFYKF